MSAAARDSLMDWQDNRRMFDQIAPRYDLLNRLMSLGMDRYWRRRAIRTLLPGEAAGRVLDIGCGTGDVSLDLLRRHAAVTVTGIDLSEAMLALAKAKATRAGLASRVSFQTGDATALAFEPETFDGIICAFCYRNIAHRAQALSEMKRVLRPGGRLVILELTVPATRLMRLAHRLYTATIVKLLGRCLSSGSAYDYLAASIAHFPRPPQVIEAIRQAGFQNAEWRALGGGAVSILAGHTPTGGPA